MWPGHFQAQVLGPSVVDKDKRSGRDPRGHDICSQTAGVTVFVEEAWVRGADDGRTRVEGEVGQRSLNRGRRKSDRLQIAHNHRQVFKKIVIK